MTGDDDHDLFDWVKAKAAKDDGMARVEEHAAPGWSDVMLDLVIEVAQRRPTFTADDVFKIAYARGIAERTHDRRAFGPVMTRAAKQGLCRKADVAPILSARASRHRAPLTVWTSLRFAPPAGRAVADMVTGRSDQEGAREGRR